MSKIIYDALIGNGLSPVGACAIMGNMYCESTLKANIVEKRCTIPDEQYTQMVDSGAMSAETFANDKYGYGLCQWTFNTRKQALLEFAKSKGVSIGDAQMQCDFCVQELKQDYPDLFKTLCAMGDLYTDTALVCKDYERPATNNIQARYNAANKYYEEYALSYTQPQSNTVSAQPEQKQGNFIDDILGFFGYKKDTTFVCDQKTWLALAKRMPTISYGSNSDAVKAMQCMLNVCGAYLHADGDWGDDTEAAFEKYKKGG